MFKIALKKKADPYIPIIGIALSLFGLIMILSSSQISALERFNDPYYFFTRQFVAWVIGMICFVFFSKVPLEVLFQYRSKLLIASAALLVAVFLPLIGGKVNEVYRWISIGPISFQPSDVAKLFVLIYFAAVAASKGDNIKQFGSHLLPLVIIAGGILALISLGRDLDTVVVVGAMIFSVLIIAGARMKHLALLLIVAAVAIGAALYTTPYRIERLKVAFTPETTSSEVSGYHARQAQIAIGTGGLWGIGFGSGVSKHAYLPESHTDSIFAVIAEELGFARTLLVIAAYLIFLWRLMLVAQKANSRFVELLAVGTATLFMTQLLLNIGGMLGLLPISGITMPLVSYGGSSLIIFLSLVGLMTNASREQR